MWQTVPWGREYFINWAEHYGCPRRTIGKIVIGAIVIGAGYKMYQVYLSNKRRDKWNQVGSDVVVLHQFERGTTIPNLSPFCLKVETYLRAAKIKYIIDNEEPMGFRGKSPWITINGNEITDSELIIEYLSKHFHNPLLGSDGGLQPQQKAIGRTLQIMMDEHAIMAVAMKRYIFDEVKYTLKLFPKSIRKYIGGTIFKKMMIRMFKKRAYELGPGRFSESEILWFLQRDLQALSNILGDNEFLFGPKMSIFDCSIFGTMTQVFYASNPDWQIKFKKDYPNLYRHHEKIKSVYWSDWDQCRSID